MIREPYILSDMTFELLLFILLKMFYEIRQIIIRKFFRTYLWLGCPHGCNDGLRSQQGDFLRVKARTILAIISHINLEIFRNLLISHIEEYNAQMLIDTLHSVTGFCRCGVTG